MSPLIQRALKLWPLLFVGLGLYIALILWFWSSSYFGAETVAARLAVGDSARKILTILQAFIAFAATGSFVWFLIAPKRNWLHGIWALAPYLFTWIVVTSVGANTSFTKNTNFKFCNFDQNTLQVSGYYDLSPEELKKPPPYFDPKTGRPMIGCADAERQREDTLAARASQSVADAERSKSERAAREASDKERRERELEILEKERVAKAKLEYPPEIKSFRIIPLEGKENGCRSGDNDRIDRAADYFTVCLDFEPAVRAYSIVIRSITESNGRDTGEWVMCKGTIQQTWNNYYCEKSNSGQPWNTGVYRVEIVIDGRLVRSRSLTIS